MAKSIRSASAFKNSLEARLRTRAAERGIPFSTLQLKVVMERLLARLFHDQSSPWLLKGGFAMDLRYRPQARTTKDIDLSITVPPGATTANLRAQLQTAADIDLGDYLSFRIGTMKNELTNAPLGGGRFPCAAVLLGKTYAKFNLDVGVGDPLIGTPEKLVGDNFLDFAGIAPAIAMAIPRAQQFAEKLHAYTFPWSDRLNTRSKDLVDLLLLIERGPPDIAELKSALTTTFAARSTHPLPALLASPPEFWKGDFPDMAVEAGLSTTDVEEAFRIVDEFWRTNDLGSSV